MDSDKEKDINRLPDAISARADFDPTEDGSCSGGESTAKMQAMYEAAFALTDQGYRVIIASPTGKRRT